MAPVAFLPSVSGGEWLIILLVIILLFGATRLPQVARALGKSFGEFKKGLREGQDQAEEKKPDEDKKDQS